MQYDIHDINNSVFVDCAMGRDEQGEAAGFDFPTPHTINCRVVRFEIGSSGHYETLLTKLPRDEFPVEEMEKIYSLR